MRRVSPYIDRRNEMEIKMTPMIDVVFLLLVFFVWTASFQIIEQVLPSQLSEATGSQPTSSDTPPIEDDFDNIVVRIGWTEGTPAWRVNEMRLSSLAEVQDRLTAIAAVKLDAPVILHPDDEVPLGHVIDLYDLTRMVGFEEIQFAASEAI